MRFYYSYEKELTNIKLLLYDPEDSVVNYEYGFMVVLYTGNYYPQAELERFYVQPEDVVLFPDTCVIEIPEYFKLSEILNNENYFIGIEGYEHPWGTGTIAIVSDDGNSGSERSFFHCDSDNTWHSMADTWGIDVNFCITAQYCYRPKTIRVPEEYSSMYEAVNAASSYDTILVNDGIYSNEGFVYNISKNIIIKSVNGPEVTIIDNSTYPTNIPFTFVNYPNDDSHRFAEIDGFTIKNCTK